MYKKILIPTDGSDLCWEAAQEGIRFAKENNAQVVAFHAIPSTSYMLFPESGPSDSIIGIFEKEADQRANWPPAGSSASRGASRGGCGWARAGTIEEQEEFLGQAHQLGTVH